MNIIIKTGLAAIAVALAPAVAPADEHATGPDLSKLGAHEYASNCATCHGASGKGDGPIVSYFAEGGYVAKNFPDLTRLSKNNKGVFPYQRVYQLIDGRTEIKAHGPREMPVWGNEYNKRAADYYMDYRQAWDGEAFTRTRILALIEYIDSLQAD